MNAKRLLQVALFVGLIAGGRAAAQSPSTYGPAVIQPGYPGSGHFSAEVPFDPAPTAQFPPPARNLPLPPAETGWEPDLSPDPVAVPEYLAGEKPGSHFGDLPPGSVVSPWLGSCSTGCCGPIGGHGPVGSEIYMHSGPSFTFGGNFLDDRLQAGWFVGGGGRTLLFAPGAHRAWTIDMGLDYTFNNGRADPIGFTIFTPTDGSDARNPTGIERVSLRALHRTTVRLTIGQEWWLWGPAYGAPGPNLRFGGDVGGFIGAAHADFNGPGEAPNDYRRDYDTIGGTIVGLRTTMELPFDGWVLLLGVRGEWRYSRVDLDVTLPKQDGDLHDFNLLLTAGLRF